MPGLGGTQRLARRIGPSRAKQLVLTGDPIDARQALEWGLANEVTHHEGLLTAALELAGTIAQNGPIAVRQAKKAIDRGYNLPIETALGYEIEAYNIAVNSEDRHEGVNAFNEKRKPVFRNR